MATTDFTDKVTVVTAAWLNDVDNFVYNFTSASAGQNFDLNGTAKLIIDADADTYIQASGDDDVVFIIGGSESERFNNTQVVFNEDGADRDFRVEGVGEANAFFIEGSTGNVGLGTNNPQARIEALGAGAADPHADWFASATFGITFLDDQVQTAQLTAFAGSTASNRPLFFGRRSRGTLDSPAVVQDNDWLFSVIASGYDGSDFQQGASINFEVDGAVSASTVPTAITFETGDSLSDREERVRIDPNGRLILTNTTADATAGPILDLYRNSASPADNDLTGQIEFNAENDVGEKIRYAYMVGVIDDRTDGTEDGQLDVYCLDGGSAFKVMEINQDLVKIDADAVEIDYGTVSLGREVTLTDTDAGAAGGPDLILDRNSASPADFDVGGVLFFRGRNDAAEVIDYAQIRMLLVDVSDGFEDGRIDFRTTIAGTQANRMVLQAGLQVGSPTGGDKGAGTINAVAVYDDNSLLTDYVLEQWVDGYFDPLKYEHRSNNAIKFFENVGQLHPKEYSRQWHRDKQLPAFRNIDKDDMSLGKLVNALWETVEVQAVHIDHLLRRIEDLENK